MNYELSTKRTLVSFFVPRHCEPAKQSSVLICTWIASQARNDDVNILSLAETKQSGIRFFKLSTENYLISSV